MPFILLILNNGLKKIIKCKYPTLKITHINKGVFVRVILKIII